MNTKQIFYVALIVFVLVILGIVLYGILSQDDKASSPRNETSITNLYSLDEVAQHNTSTDCWMVIGEQVLDLSNYISEHPTAPEVIVPYCGKEATNAYDTKGDRGRAHSDYANKLLGQYNIGKIKK